jgi:hypothetical protein
MARLKCAALVWKGGENPANVQQKRLLSPALGLTY